MAGPEQKVKLSAGTGAGKSAQSEKRLFFNFFASTRMEKKLSQLEGEMGAWAKKYAWLITGGLMRGTAHCNMASLGSILANAASLNKNAAFSFSEKGSHLSFGEKEAKKDKRYYNQLTVSLHEKNGNNGGEKPVLNISVFTNPGGNWTAHVEYGAGYAPNGTFSSSTPLSANPEKMGAFGEQLQEMKVAEFIAAFDPSKKHK